MKLKRISYHSQRIIWTIECNRVMWYAECKRLPWIWNLRSRCSAGAWSCENVPPGAGLQKISALNLSILQLFICASQFRAYRLWCSSSAFASCPQNATSTRSIFGKTVSSASGQATNYSFARRSICPLWKVSLWIIDENEGSYAAIGNSGNVIYTNPRKDLVVAVSGYFKPTVFDRIDFIKEQIEEKL